MTLETFKNFVTTLNRMQELCSTFDENLEKILNQPFLKNGYTSDSRSMLLFPVEGIDNLFIEALISEFGETREGAEWFVYEGIDQINNGGTKIDETEIKTFEEYYNWLEGLKNEIKK